MLPRYSEETIRIIVQASLLSGDYGGEDHVGGWGGGTILYESVEISPLLCGKTKLYGPILSAVGSGEIILSQCGQSRPYSLPIGSKRLGLHI